MLHIDDEPTVYHMGDTDIFADMALVNELHAPQVGLVPVGDRFTMGGAVAALACQRYFNFETVVPMHYGTFPIIDQTPETFVTGMGPGPTEVLTPKTGRNGRYLINCPVAKGGNALYSVRGKFEPGEPSCP